MPRLIYTVARCTLHIARCLLSLVATCHSVVSCLSVASCLLRQQTRPSARTARRQLVPPRSRVAKRRGKAKGFSSICKGNSCRLAARISTTMQCTQGQFSLQGARSLSLSQTLFGCGEFALGGWIWFVGGICFHFAGLFTFFVRFSTFSRRFSWLSLSLYLRNHLICWSRGASLPPPKWKGLFVLSRNMNPYQSKSFGKCGKIFTIY